MRKYGQRELKALVKDGAAVSFEEAVNSFEYYNLRGKRNRTAFYIPVRTVDRFTGEKPTAGTLGTVQEYDYSYIGQ